MKFSGKSKNNQGKFYQGGDIEALGVFAGKGDFNNMKDAKNAFYGDSTDLGASVFGISKGKQLPGYKGDRGMWTSAQLGISFGLGHLSENETWKAGNSNSNTKEVNIIFDKGNRKEK